MGTFPRTKPSYSTTRASKAMSFWSKKEETPAPTFEESDGPTESDKNLATALYEMQGVQDMFTRLSTKCFEKCVQKYHGEADLAVGETACLDRCVVKYVETQTQVGELLKKMGEENQQMT